MIGKRIKSARESVRLSQTELANKIGVSKQTLYKYENGIITNIPSDKIEAISRAVNVTPAYLMGWDDSEPEPFICTPVEQAFVERYREADDGTRAAVNKLLDIPEAGTDGRPTG